MSNDDTKLSEIKKQIEESFKVFGRTSLNERIKDILSEAIELSRFSNVRSMKEETGDLLSSLIMLCVESDWSVVELIESTLDKINAREKQYKSIGRKTEVAVIGGAFDPPTIGHLDVAKILLKTSLFDEVWFMPCNQSGHGKQMSSAYHRLAMCTLLCEEELRIRVCGFEVEKELGSSTLYTFKKMTDEPDFEHYRLSFVIGQDNANVFHTWTNWEELQKLVKFVVVPRLGIEPDPKVTWYFKRPHMYLANELPTEVSSSLIRTAIKTGSKELGNLVLPSVLFYIEENELYRE